MGRTSRISLELAECVHAALQEETSSRVASRFGLGKTVVDSIRTGLWFELYKRRKIAEAQRRGVSPYERCPGCGGKVIMPCKLCRAREAQENKRIVGAA